MSKKIKTKVGFAKDAKVIEVVVPDGEPEPWGLDAKLRVVGTSVPRVDAVAKVSGQAKYTFDINLQGMLHAKMLLSPHGAASIKSLDAGPAEAMEGVRAVHVLKGAGRPLQHDGDEILAIAADTEEIALDAIRAVKVEYDVKRCVTTIDAAMAKDAPRVHEDRENAGRERSQGSDVDRIIQGSPVTLEATYETQVQTHSALESHGAVARWEPGGGLTVWCSTQGTFGTRGQIAQHTGLPANRIRVLADHVGGGFGGKLQPGTAVVTAVDLAKKAGRPVKLMLTRADEHKLGGNRPSSKQVMKAGVGRDGRIRAIEVTVYGSGGVGGGGGAPNPMIYSFGNVHKKQVDVYTNGGAALPFRAPGHPQASFAMEGFLDELAEMAGLDPLEFRKRNCDATIYHEQWDLAAERIGWARRNRNPGAGKGPKVRGLGMASSRWGQLGSTGHEVEIILYKDGSIDVRNGAQDIGTGTKTVLAVVAAEELGVEPSSLRVLMGDTNLPKGPGSGGSQTAPALAPAARAAAIEAKKEILKLVGDEVGADPVFADGHVKGRRKSLTLREALSRMKDDQVAVRGVRAENYAMAGDERRPGVYRGEVAGCQFAEVEVDLETGQVRVIKVVAVQDAGRVIDRLTFESQVAGGVIQGISYALFEERLLDPASGRMLNADFLNYKIAGTRDMPEIEAIAFDVANAGNSVGIAGLGEPPTIPTAAAIGNAIANATGFRIRSLPITPAKILAAGKR